MTTELLESFREQAVSALHCTAHRNALHCTALLQVRLGAEAGLQCCEPDYHVTRESQVEFLKAGGTSD
jgi:hypothetical protein